MPLHFLCSKPRTNASNVHKKPIIPDDMVIASPADLGRLDWPGVNFAFTEFYEVRKAVRNGSCMSNRKNTYSR